MANDRPHWRVSYAGATSYQWKGQEFEIRTHSMGADFPWNGDYRRFIHGKVGCILWAHNAQEFPPAEFCAFFPEYVPVRYSADWQSLEYQGDRPRTQADPTHDGGIVATAWVERSAAWEAFFARINDVYDTDFPRWRRAWDTCKARDCDCHCKPPAELVAQIDAILTA